MLWAFHPNYVIEEIIIKIFMKKKGKKERC